MYRGSQHGFAPNDFHSKCNGYRCSDTLTIIKADPNSFVFGPFTTATWDSSNKHKSDKDAFLFSLTNKENFPCKINMRTSQIQYAICCWPGVGPAFGSGSDIRICEKWAIAQSWAILICIQNIIVVRMKLNRFWPDLLSDIEVYQKV